MVTRLQFRAHTGFSRLSLTGSFGASPAQERTLQPVQYNKPQPPTNTNPIQNYPKFQNSAPPPLPQQAPQPPPPIAPPAPAQDVDMKTEASDAGDADGRPQWMKPRLMGVRKISNKERRRRQNENLRRLLTPKSALMVLNEIMPKEQVSNERRRRQNENLRRLLTPKSALMVLNEIMPKEQVSNERRRRQNENLRRLLTPKSALMALNEIMPKEQVSNERRRRQNENLRRLLTPKNALTVLNEIMPKEQLSYQFVIAPVGGNSQYYNTTGQSFCADLTLEGNNYKGYGDTKLTARNAAAEQAVRDLILRKMAKVLLPEVSETTPAAPAEGSSEAEGEGPAEETLPMIQLASFALHKLFSEWEYDGHRVPQLRASNSVSGQTAEESAPETEAPPPRAKAPPKKRTLPDNAASMHPSMLLSYMRPQLEYRELSVEGDRPQNMMFTMGIDVDGTTFMGKATNKKEARKMAARAACTALFDVTFNE
ncbi:double-stranded RNA-specific editase 1 isoform X2 [Bicyclus anynana]|uniref:Double-stranded RNA-specific editase 1 isoform X2 n=1 Tax=Bicyclus anynana TaxID=110368 RepID=A0ABM3LR42_BICAN|nr:double-stranded RNA-specific editase 1 isoform X2 [Bicyclus anynana]